ncbi:MAG: SRPBCC family protein [Kofleriaceae bacterium]
MYILERHQHVAAPRREVFAFFADAANLEQMTPRGLGFTILTRPPIVMRAGARIDYRIKLHGLPMTWHTLIEQLEPDQRFIDVQLKGPYAVWRHTHSFADAPDGGTELGDRIVYELPLGPLGKIAHALFVKRQLEQIFDYRARVMTERFG